MIIPFILGGDGSGAMLYGLFVYFASVILTLVVSIYIYYVFIKETILGISLEEEPQFELPASTFFWKNLLWSLLSLITFGIYMPWHLRNVLTLIGDSTSYKGKTYKFLGVPSDFLGKYIAILVVTMATSMYLNSSVTSSEPIVAGAMFGIAFSYLFLIVLQLAVYALITVWVIDLEYDGKRISYRGGIGRLVGKMMVELLLSFITLGIYTPVAMYGVARYAINKIGYGENGQLVQSGKKLSFFGWAWLQMVLCAVTLGIYTPWAYAKLLNLIVDETSLVISEDRESFSDETAV
jgi:uncharacterized membrane protein YjgN (DUF898 family)